jgi:hypothetical protein
MDRKDSPYGSAELAADLSLIATQNPIELEGTCPFPEAQVDRFLMRLFFRAPDFNVLKEILRATEGRGLGPPAWPPGIGASSSCPISSTRHSSLPRAPSRATHTSFSTGPSTTCSPAASKKGSAALLFRSLKTCLWPMTGPSGRVFPRLG